MKHFIYGMILGMAAISIPAGADATSETDLELTVTVSKPVKEDILVAWLYFRVEGADSDTVQQQLNAKMKDVWAIASGIPAIESKLEGYHTWYDDGTRGSRLERLNGTAPQDVTPKWIARQYVRLQAEDADAVKGLVDRLQAEGMALSYFDYEVSPALFEQARESLMQPAAEKLVRKARLLAQAFGAELSGLKEVNVGGRSNRYGEVSMAAASSGYSQENRVVPVAEPEDQEVYFTLGGLTVMTMPDLKL